MGDIQGYDTAEKNASNQSGGTWGVTDAPEANPDPVPSLAPQVVDVQADAPKEFKHNYELPVPDEDAYESQFGIIVVVENEAEQIQAFANIKALGYSVRVVTI